MKLFSKHAVMLVVLLTTSTSVFAQSRATPLERAQQIAELTTGGPHDPAPAVPLSDIVDHQRELRPR